MSCFNNYRTIRTIGSKEQTLFASSFNSRFEHLKGEYLSWIFHNKPRSSLAQTEDSVDNSLLNSSLAVLLFMRGRATLIASNYREQNHSKSISPILTLWQRQQKSRET